jgi:hypothetical protein
MNIRPRSRTVPVAAGLALAAAACGSEAGTDFRPRAEQPSTAAACTFGWPVPTRGRARQRMVSGGHVMEFRYVVRLERAPDGDGLALYREDVEVETVDDRRPAGDVEWMVATLEFGMPPLRIGADGSYRGMLDLDGYLADAAGPLEAILARDGLDETTRRAVQATVSMRSVPAAGPLLEASAGLAWLAWVGDWLGCELAPGAREDATVTASLPWGPYDAPVVRRNLGYVRAPAGHVDLRAPAPSGARSWG